MQKFDRSEENRKCVECGAHMDYKESEDKFVCPSCGHEVK